MQIMTPCLVIDTKTKEALIDWVGDFLWHFEHMCSGGPEECPDVPPKIIIVETILGAIMDSQDGHNKKSNQLPAASTFFQLQDSQKG